MSNARKGKACIIACTEFDNMNPLSGYNTDRKKLTQLWHIMGFDVVVPNLQEGERLTADVKTSH